MDPLFSIVFCFPAKNTRKNQYEERYYTKDANLKIRYKRNRFV